GFGGPTYVATEYGRPAMVQNWSLELQKQLAPDLILSIGYVGMHATRLRSNLAQVNNLNPKFFGLGSDLSQDINSPTATADGVSSPFAGFSGSIGQALRPLPQYTLIDSDCCLENVGQSSYNGLL